MGWGAIALVGGAIRVLWIEHAPYKPSGLVLDETYYRRVANGWVRYRFGADIAFLVLAAVTVEAVGVAAFRAVRRAD